MCTYVHAFVSTDELVYVHPAQHLLGNHSRVQSLTPGAGPLCSAGACHSSLTTGDSPFLGHRGHSVVHRLDRGVPFCPPGERSGKDKPEGARCPRCDHRRQLPGNVRRDTKTDSRSKLKICAQKLSSHELSLYISQQIPLPFPFIKIFLLPCMAWISVPKPGSDSCLLQWKGGVLTTASSGKSLILQYLVKLLLKHLSGLRLTSRGD